MMMKQPDTDAYQHHSTSSSTVEDVNKEHIYFDWRVHLFGDQIHQSPCPSSSISTVSEESDEENARKFTTATPEAFGQDNYDYIAIYFGADYCPDCKLYSSIVKDSVADLEVKRCKTVFVSCDRNNEAYETSCKNLGAGVDSMPYDMDRTMAMREMFGVKTIPALMLVRNDNKSASSATVVGNIRHALTADRNLHYFPWSSEASKIMSTADRMLIRGHYGKWWHLGHHVNPEKPHQMYMDDHAVRIRAGILNVITWLALLNIFFWRETLFFYTVFPVVMFEFVTSATIGLTPIAPIGTLASVLAPVFWKEPSWAPARPKSFAWFLGLSMAMTCFVLFFVQEYLGDATFRPVMGIIVSFLNLATWLESACGFCVGCFIYNKFVVPILKLEKCTECK